MIDLDTIQRQTAEVINGLPRDRETKTLVVYLLNTYRDRAYKVARDFASNPALRELLRLNSAVLLSKMEFLKAERAAAGSAEFAPPAQAGDELAQLAAWLLAFPAHVGTGG